MSFPTQVTPNGTWSIDGTTNNVGPIGPFADTGTRRFMLLFDDAAFVFRSMKSDDTGQTWAEVDAAHAPAGVDDIGSPNPGLYEYFGVVQNSRKLFLVFWDTDFTVSLKPFDMSTELWGATIKSTLTYLSGDYPASNQTGFGVAYRGSDNSVWMMFAAGITSSGTVPNRVWGAKCDLTGSAWDASLTNLGTADNSDLLNWQAAGMTGPDGSGNLHLFFVGYSGTTFQPTPPFTGAIYHRVLRSDNSLGAIDTVASTSNNSVPLPFDNVSTPFISPGGTLSLSYTVITVGGSGREQHIVRGAAAEAPTWEDVVPSDPNFQGNRAFASTITLNGTDYCFFTYSSGLNRTFAYMTSSAIGQPWSVGTVIGSNSGEISSAVQAAAFASSWAITTGFGLSPDGQAYFETAAPSAPFRQLVFKGVRRITGNPQPCATGIPKSFTYVRSVSLTLGETSTLSIPINDFPFELYQLILLGQNGAVVSPLTSSLATLWLYDRNRVQISNLPVQDIFLDGGPNGLYRDGAFVPPLCYPKDSSIQIDVTGLVSGQSLIICAVGRRIYPC